MQKENKVISVSTIRFWFRTDNGIYEFGKIKAPWSLPITAHALILYSVAYSFVFFDGSTQFNT